VDVWTWDLQRSAALSLTFVGTNDDPVWSPDGQRLGWQGADGIRAKAASGAGSETTIFQNRSDIMPSQWSPDGRMVLFTASGAMPGARSAETIWGVDVNGGTAREIVGNQGLNVRQGQLSPDGRWLAYASNETRRYEVYVQDYPALRGRWQISTRSGIAPRWRRDGRELFYLDSDGRVMAVSLEVRDSSLTVGNPALLFETGMGSHAANRSFAWDVDATGSRFYNPEPRQQQLERQPMVVIRDWKPSRAAR
jgi:Tol biopolymer transport system component